MNLGPLGQVSGKAILAGAGATAVAIAATDTLLPTKAQEDSTTTTSAQTVKEGMLLGAFAAIPVSAGVEDVTRRAKAAGFAVGMIGGIVVGDLGYALAGSPRIPWVDAHYAATSK